MAMMARGGLLLLLVGAMVGLTLAALASPPDQHWLGGLYDDADYDDVVLAVVASVAVVVFGELPDTRFAQSVVAVVLSTGESRHTLPTLSPNHTRAPPAS